MAIKDSKTADQHSLADLPNRFLNPQMITSYFVLNSIVLGIRQTQAGGIAFEISPWVGDLTSASGAMATPKGPVRVAWKLKKGQLQVNVSAPKGVKVTFKANDSFANYEINSEIK